MQVRGLERPILIRVADELGLELENLRRIGRVEAFRLVPFTSRDRYARRSATPAYAGGKSKRLKATCYHGFRDFIRLAFRQGATGVESAWGFWPTLAAFETDLPRLASANIGNPARPCRMIDTCECVKAGREPLSEGRPIGQAYPAIMGGFPPVEGGD